MAAAPDPLLQQALERFGELYAEAQSVESGETTAMTLATADPDGRPSARIVLLKHFDARGFTFYTNYRSRKGRALRANPQAALLFWWRSMDRQVRVEGAIETVDDADADAYWATRPRESQLGAWASDQSEPLASREEYERRLTEYRERFDGVDVPRPPHWSGFRVVPDRIEFWHERAFRQHDREHYWLDGETWQWSLLYP